MMDTACGKGVHSMDNTPLQVISIAAIVIGPVLALMTQRLLDHVRERGKRKLALFQSLLTSRAMPMSIPHVQALNTIELEFYPRRGKNTRGIDAWRIYCNHLNQPQTQDPTLVQAWSDRRQDLIVDLLYEMAQSLGYDFEKVMIKRDSYYPSGLTNMENEQTALRQAAVKVFEGKDSLRVRIDPQ
jgi:hypothetical protein